MSLLGQAALKAKAAQINADPVSVLPAGATDQQNQQMSQPERPSTGAASQSASDINSLLHESVGLDQVELGLVSRSPRSVKLIDPQA